jgi:aldose 1-epimerase
MTCQVRTEARPCKAGMDGTVYLLEDPDAGTRAEVWPALGFNCIAWHAGGHDRLWSDPALYQDARPTRSGIPILFPFPNRIRGGHFTWKGRTYQLPISDPQKKNAIHGFAAFRPWSVTDAAADSNGAHLTARFRGSEHAPECAHLWPADYELTATYRLNGPRLTLDLTVTNPDREELPFGLGLHPYFRMPADKARIAAPPLERWELEGCLPTGRVLPLEGPHELLRTGQPLGAATFDDLYRVTEPGAVMVDVRGPERGLTLTAEGFPFVVAFTPPHREAVCVEPYTCATDLFAGPQTGLLVLPPGGRWQGTVTLEAGA